jgi:hypothetical protein
VYLQIVVVNVLCLVSLPFGFNRHIEFSFAVVLNDLLECHGNDFVLKSFLVYGQAQRIDGNPSG